MARKDDDDDDDKPTKHEAKHQDPKHHEAKHAEPPPNKDDQPSGMKIEMITSFRRKDGRVFGPGKIVEATTAEVKLLVGGGYATIAKDDAVVSPLPEPDPL